MPTTPNPVRNFFAWALLAGCFFVLFVSGCGTSVLRKPEVQTPSSAFGSKVAATAKKQIGTPYRYGGKAPGGFDCSGLTYYCFKKNGVKLPRSAKEQMKVGRSVRLKDIRPGDLVFFRTGQANDWHVGIFAGKGRFIHAPRSGRKVEAQRMDMDYYRRRFVTARRVTG
jgi:cell wall-associated NlpC family hydrolase